MATHLYKDYTRECPKSPHVISNSKAMLTTLCGSVINPNGFNNAKITKDIGKVDCIQCAGIFYLKTMGRR